VIPDEQTETANADADAAPQAAPAKPTRRKAAPYTHDQLREVLAVSDAQMHGHLLPNLIHDLKADHRLNIREINGGAHTAATMGGITAVSTAGNYGAIHAWAAAARRRLLEVDAE